MADDPNVEPQDQPKDTPPADEPKEKDPIQQIKSWVGRIEAQSKEDRNVVKAALQTMQEVSRKLDEDIERRNTNLYQNNEYTGYQRFNDPSLQKINEDWQNRILAGDVVGVFDEYMALSNQAKDNLTKTNRNKVDKLLGDYANEPFFPNIKNEVHAMAYELVAKGKSPEDAVELAYAKKESAFTKGIVATINKQSPQSLEFLKGGKGKTGESQTKGKLPDNLKAAAKRDIEEGIFKDEKEYMDNLSPQVKEKYGIL